MPADDAVLAITSGTANMGEVMQKAWDHLRPAMSSTPLPQDNKAHQSLRDRIDSLQLPPGSGRISSPISSEINGQTFAFAENAKGIESLTLRCSDQQTTLSIQDAEGQHDFVCGHNQWTKGRMPSIGSLASRLPRSDDVGVAGSGCWSDDDTYELKLWFFETPYRLDLKLEFDGQQVVLNGKYNVGFGATALPTLIGTKQE